MLCFCGFELYSRWVPLIFTSNLDSDIEAYLIRL